MTKISELPQTNFEHKDPESKKHKVYYMGKFIKEIEFDTMETCFLSQSYRYYNKGFLIGVMPFDYSFFASNGEIIRFDELEPTEKNEKLILEIESTSFTIPGDHGFIKLKIPYGWSKIKHLKKGMKVVLKKFKNKKS